MKFTLNTYLSSFRKYGYFSWREWLRILVVSVVFGFIFSFRMWGQDTYNPFSGILNWLSFTIFSFLTLVFMLIGGKFASLKFGFRMEYRMWKAGLITNVFLTFITNGFSIFLLPGGFDLKQIETLQLGKFVQSYSPYRKRAYIVFWSLFSMFLFVAIIKSFFPESIAYRMVFTSAVISAWSFLPLEAVVFYFIRDYPPSFGSSLIMGPIGFTFFTIVFYLINILIMFFITGILPIFISIIISTIAFLFFITFIAPEKLYG